MVRVWRAGTELLTRGHTDSLRRRSTHVIELPDDFRDLLVELAAAGEQQTAWQRWFGSSKKEEGEELQARLAAVKS